MWLKDCTGCRESKGHPAWAAHLDAKIGQEEGVVDETCPIFSCCTGKELVHCGPCAEIPCEIWFKLKDPTMTQEQHLKWINERVDHLTQA